MSDATRTTGLQLRSLITKSGELELSLAKVEMPEPGPDEVVVQVEATPINPSDLGLLLGPADLATANVDRQRRRAVVTAPVAAGRAALPRRAPRPVDAGRQRRRGHGDRGGLLARPRRR